MWSRSRLSFVMGSSTVLKNNTPHRVREVDLQIRYFWVRKVQHRLRGPAPLHQWCRRFGWRSESQTVRSRQNPTSPPWGFVRQAFVVPEKAHVASVH